MTKATESLLKNIEQLEKENAQLKKQLEQLNTEMGKETKLRYFSRAVEQSPASIVITNLQGEIEYVNPKFIELTGYRLDEVIGQNPRVLKSGETSSDEYKGLWESIMAGQEWHGEFHNRKKNGELYWEFASISPIIDDEGNVTHFLAVKEDITERKAMEAELLKLYQAVEQSPASIVITSLEGNIEYVNPKFLEVTGYRKEEVIGKNPRVLKSGETSSNEYKGLWESITAGKERDGEFHNRKKNGELYWEFAAISPVVDEKGSIMYFLAIKEDITKRKEMEEKLINAYNRIKAQQNQMLDELEQARDTQRSLLPDELPVISGAKIACKYVPMEQIGGDYYNIFPVEENKFGIIVADVTGHGVSAALISFMISAIFSESCKAGISTKLILELVNESLQNKLQEGKFATMVYGVYDASTQTLAYTSAGHPDGLVIRPPDHEVVPLQTEGMLIGLFPNEIANYEEKTFHLQPGDKVLFYTDAIIEVMDENRQLLGVKRLSDFLVEHSKLPVDILLEKVYEYGLEYSGRSSYDDDFTMIGLEVSKE